MKKTAVFYSPQGGNVNDVANKLGALIGNDRVDIIPVNQAEAADVDKYNQIILAGSTVGADHWNNEKIVDEWAPFFERIAGNGLKGKKAAIMGLGNSLIYPDHFAADMADLYTKTKNLGAEIFGFVDAKDYDFTDSDAVNEDGFFCGLAIDEDNEPELTEGRLKKWISQLSSDFDF